MFFLSLNVYERFYFFMTGVTRRENFLKKDFPRTPFKNFYIDTQTFITSKVFEERFGEGLFSKSPSP